MSKPQCSIGGCDRSVKALGYCNMHYIRSRTGTPMDKPPLGFIPQETVEMIGRLIEDEASLSEIYRTTGIRENRVRKFYPDYAGWGRGHSERRMSASKVTKELNRL